MCIVCKDWKAGRLTSEEALRNLGEMIVGSEKNSRKRKHYFEVSEKILDKEVPSSDTDEELDKNWHEETHED